MKTEEQKIKARQAAKAYYERNKEKSLARMSQYRLDNLEDYQEYQKKYRKKKQPHLTHLTALYAAKEAAPQWLSESDLLRIKCIYEVAAMRNRESDDSWNVDHIIPLRGKEVCGLHVPWNLSVITAQENRKKGNRLESIV